MAKIRSRFVPGVSFADEVLEQRMVPSGAGVNLAQGAAEVSVRAIRNSPTKTAVAVSAGTLGEPIRFTVTVRASSSAGAPTGSVKIMDRGRMIGTATLSPNPSSAGRFATSTATFVLNQEPGGAAYYFGRHRVSAVFVPEGSFARSTVAKAFVVVPPSYTDLANGVKIDTIATGSGPVILAGQTANVLYTGYLAKNGRIFDASNRNGGAPLAFRVGVGQVIPGFDAGTLGMRVGESRIILIPPDQGYGPIANGPIPANSTLLFVVTLKSIG